MTILIYALETIGLAMSALMLATMALMTIKAHNMRKHGTWWGNSPEWLCNLMDLIP